MRKIHVEFVGEVCSCECCAVCLFLVLVSHITFAHIYANICSHTQSPVICNISTTGVDSMASELAHHRNSRNYDVDYNRSFCNDKSCISTRRRWPHPRVHHVTDSGRPPLKSIKLNTSATVWDVCTKFGKLYKRFSWKKPGGKKNYLMIKNLSSWIQQILIFLQPATAEDTLRENFAR